MRRVRVTAKIKDDNNVPVKGRLIKTFTVSKAWASGNIVYRFKPAIPQQI
jgi:hypothetical protein